MFSGQTIFWVGIYSGAVEDKLAQFTDVCRYICFLIKPIIYWHISETCYENLFSLANISVFVMSHANFGYYIHGEIVKDVLLWCPKRKTKF